MEPEYFRQRMRDAMRQLPYSEDALVDVPLEIEQELEAASIIL